MVVDVDGHCPKMLKGAGTSARKVWLLRLCLGVLNVVQHWRSFDHPERYARNRNGAIGRRGWSSTADMRADVASARDLPRPGGGV
jgi:hypothetical protein